MKGILFSEPLFPLVVNGSKTQTRRIIKPQPDDSGLHNHTLFPLSIDSDLKGFWGTEEETGECKEFKPRYKVGDIVYLKEPYIEKTDPFGNDMFLYKYDGHGESEKRWTNKLYMPASAARYFIEITGVKVERLRDISDEDCLKEGIYKLPNLEPCTFYGISHNGVDACLGVTPREAYADLINSIDGKGAWESNPFMWVYEFKIVES